MITDKLLDKTFAFNSTFWVIRNSIKPELSGANQKSNSHALFLSLMAILITL